MATSNEHPQQNDATKDVANNVKRKINTGDAPEQPYQRVAAYVLAEELAIMTAQIQGDMAKKYKYGVGNDLFQAAMTISRCIGLVYVERDIAKKIELLETDVRDAIINAQILNRVCLNINAQSRKQFVDQAVKLAKLMEQSVAWASRLKTDIDSEQTLDKNHASSKG